jgi:NAD(P)H-flavin reductase
MNNIYQPIPMRIERIIQETDDASLRSFELSFKKAEDEIAFFKAYNPGQFCQLSIFGKGEAPFGVASAAWEGSFVRFTVQNVGSASACAAHWGMGSRSGTGRGRT